MQCCQNQAGSDALRKTFTVFFRLFAPEESLNLSAEPFFLPPTFGMETEMLQFNQVKWDVVLTNCGISSNYLRNTLGPCPICLGTPSSSGANGGEGRGDTKKGKRSTRFRFDNKGGLGTWFCNHCGAGNGFTLLKKFHNASDADVLRMIEEKMGCTGAQVAVEAPITQYSFEEAFSPKQVAANRRNLKKAWAAAMPLSRGDAASLYLMQRVPGLDFSKISSAIRFHPGMDYFVENKEGKFISQGKYPTMLAKAVDSSDTAITLHRTHLTDKGGKADVDEVKKQMRGVRKLGGAAVRLNEVPDSRILGVVEGIETGFAVATAYRNTIEVWSLLNCFNLSIADIPVGRYDLVIIFADHDHVDPAKKYRPGEHYANLLKSRLEAAGQKVEIRIPDKEGEDFADVWLEHYRNKRITPNQSPQKANSQASAKQLCTA